MYFEMQHMQHLTLIEHKAFYCLLPLPDSTQSVNLSARDNCGSGPGSRQALYWTQRVK